MNCPDCGARNPAGAAYCGECGEEIKPAQETGGSGGSSWDNTFKWIGMIVVGLFVFGLLTNF